MLPLCDSTWCQFLAWHVLWAGCVVVTTDYELPMFVCLELCFNTGRHHVIVFKRGVLHVDAFTVSDGTLMIFLYLRRYYHPWALLGRPTPTKFSELLAG